MPGDVSLTHTSNHAHVAGTLGGGGNARASALIGQLALAARFRFVSTLKANRADAAEVNQKILESVQNIPDPLSAIHILLNCFCLFLMVLQ